MFRRLRDPNRRNQRGVIIIWMVVFLLIILGFVALGMDGAKLMTTRSQLQNAADAAALAGATNTMNPLTGTLVDGLVKDHVAQTGLQNRAYTNSAVPVVIDTTNDVTIDPVERTVRVIARREGTDGMVVHLAQVVGLHKLDVRAEATAKVAIPSRVCRL